MADRSRNHRSSRSQSPPRQSSHNTHRTRSPHRQHHHRKPPRAEPATPVTLPYNARALTKHDFKVFKPLFALYLDLQKGRVLEDLDEVEAKGRWKSFIGKWNRGEISEGYYDPSMLQRAQQSAGEAVAEPITRPKRGIPPSLEPVVVKPTRRDEQAQERQAEEEDESEDEIGPALPGQESRSRGRFGPTIPNMQDLELKREAALEDGLSRRDDIRYERKQDRKSQKEALDELVPRAEAGTRERQLEKKKEVNEKMKSFREKSPGAAEVPEQELMGGEEEFKKLKEGMQRKKNERELRREENLRARMEEREERLGEYRAKEDKTMAMLKELAKQRFGKGS